MMAGVVAGGGRAVPVEPPVAEAASIFADLRAWWEFEENDSSTAFLDAHGSNDLSIINGDGADETTAVSSANAGVVGRNYVSNLTPSENSTLYIPRANTALDLPNADFSFGGWFKVNRQTGLNAAFVMGRVGDGVLTSLQAWLALDGTTGDIVARASSDGTTVVSTATYSGRSSTEWQLVVLTLDRTNDLLIMRHQRPGANGGSVHKVQVAFAGALYTGGPGNANFTIGDGVSNDGDFWPGSRNGVVAADQCFFVDKALSDDEFAYLYNGSIGRSYAQLVDDAT